MDIPSMIMGAMFVISESLLYPAIILLLLLVIWTLLTFGRFISEYSGRVRDIEGLRNGCMETREHLRNGHSEKAASALTQMKTNYLLTKFLQEISKTLDHETCRVELEKILDDYEITISKELEGLKILTRTAPMLGLMGTLIPLGPALLGLSSGDIQMLATSLVIAFSTTVLGLFVGGIAYALLLIRRRWYIQDLSDMEFITRMIP
ncbi:MotA/TolQ/ExbB proton channel family protein [Methanocalculus taiwanensis]|uniref:MotA/TolQ/ExbB proton channel family protein n=1 Tax=Methanocalculus taiwanensis TaxID=106207 RepID=A0ABD4TIR9_9EURY|nr:MotA/TolQ/ExbB proton channel family protein [Methanocalculus taiwanensis]MCQ1538828.1 MotA/TolQ/ExbB proton channel family protein [Methanocalculus taiwanensis]